MQLAVDPDVQIGFLTWERASCLQRGQLAGAQHGLREALERKGLEQIVDRLQFEALQGVIGVGRGENDEWRAAQRLHQLQAGQPGHVDVEE